MSKKYVIICDDDNSFKIENDASNKVVTEVRDMLSFSLQYIYTVLNYDEILLSESAKQTVINSINSFEFDKRDIKELSLLIVKIGDKMNKSMMTYENGIPKLWEDEI